MGDCCNTSKLDNPFHDDFNGMLYVYDKSPQNVVFGYIYNQ